MNMRKMLLISIIIIFLVALTVGSYALILNKSNDVSNVLPHNTNNNTTNSTGTINTTSQSTITNQNNNTNNQKNTNNNNNTATKNNNNEPSYNTADGKPRTSRSQSGYSELRQSMNEYSDYVDREGKYDPWTMGKYETGDGDVLYFNR